jgi:uncharacterized protein YraI
MRHASSRMLFALAVAAIPLSASADNAFTLRDSEVYTGPGSEYVAFSLPAYWDAHYRGRPTAGRTAAGISGSA